MHHKQTNQHDKAGNSSLETIRTQSLHKLYVIIGTTSKYDDTKIEKFVTLDELSIIQ